MWAAMRSCLQAVMKLPTTWWPSDLDPWATLASGALIATFPADRADRAVADLTARGHSAAVIGVVAGGRGVRDRDGVAVPNPPRDEVARLGVR
jgi:hydrogenase expression/formation protein HypE